MDSGSQNVKQEPWKEQKPFLKQGFEAAQELFEGHQRTPYPEQGFASLTPQQLQALDLMAQRGLYGSQAEQTGLNQLQSTAYGGYLGQNPYAAYAMPLASGQQQYANPLFSLGMNQAYGGEVGYNPLYQMGAQTASGGNLYNDPRFGAISSLAYGGGVGQNPLYDMLGGVASGQEIGSNPYLDATFDQAASRVGDAYSKYTAPSTLAAFSNARGGNEWSSPDAMQEVQSLQARDLGDRLNDLATNIYGGDYQAGQQRRLQAAGALGGTYGQEIGQQLGAAGQLGGAYGAERGLQQAMQGALGGTYSQEQAARDAMISQFGGAYNTGVNQQLQGIQSLSSPYEAERQRMLAAGGQLPGISQATDYGNISNLYASGQPLQQLEQSAIQQAMADWNFSQQEPYNQLAQYMAMIQGQYGGQTQQSNQIGAGGILGGLTQLAGATFPFWPGIG
jgi:hypothetical protein